MLINDQKSCGEQRKIFKVCLATFFNIMYKKVHNKNTRWIWWGVADKFQFCGTNLSQLINFCSH